ncbi:MAG: hypothetical protein JO300_06115 [Silvibacterium sp.]|nr:hypothetical protein [Silvibacterium sp.]
MRDGFTKGAIYSIAQTPDGYLWLATEFGLVRFDGVRAVPWQPPAGQQLPSSFIFALLVGRDGTLWIGTTKGLASLRDGRITRYPELTGRPVISLLEDRQGTVWAGEWVASGGKLCSIHNQAIECYGKDGSLGPGVLRLFEDKKGDLWATGARGFWHWKPGPPRFYPLPKNVVKDHAVQSMAEDENGLLIGGPGLRRLSGDRLEDYLLPASAKGLTVMRMLRDGDGALWIGLFGGGLVHIHNGRTDMFSRLDGLSGNMVNSVFQDREGSVWIATSDGLDRFRAFAVPTYAAGQGLSFSGGGAVLAARDGSIWAGAVKGLARLDKGQVTIYRGAKTEVSGLDAKAVREIVQANFPESFYAIFQDRNGRIWAATPVGLGYLEGDQFHSIPGVHTRIVVSIAEDRARDLWVDDQDNGLFRLRDGIVVQKIPWPELGVTSYPWRLAVDPVNGGLWIGISGSGVAYFRDGQIRARYTSADGVGEGIVNDLHVDRDRTLWAPTEAGLSRIKDGHVITLTSRNGLPCDTVHWMEEDDQHSIWLYTACGLVRFARADLDAWSGDPRRILKISVFDSTDGVRVLGRSTGFAPQVSKSPDGRIWFSALDGVSVLDPQHLPFNKLPPPVHIEQITADHKTYDVTSDANGSVRLPPLVRDLEIDYTALSLVAPEKVLFRYKLDGWDRDWQDAGTRRQAFYSNLPPRRYRFRVIACNNSGVWNEAGSSLDFSVAPAYYQTAWFRLSCVAALLALLYAFYRLRLYQQARLLNVHFEARLAERTRIARDLHDTMLQSFLGVMLKLHTIPYIPNLPAEARKRLEGILEQGQEAINEGRDAVHGMRSSTVIKNDLACALATVGETLAAEQNGQSPVDFRVVVEGESRDLHPILRDEVYRIAREATINAFRHSGAGRIKVEISYDRKQLRVRVQDNGKGIDTHFLDGGGREGHFGMPGMQERAKLAGGKLTVRSKLDSGTEVELTIPASIAYAKLSAPRQSVS